MEQASVEAASPPIGKSCDPVASTFRTAALFCAALLLVLGASTAHATDGDLVWVRSMGGTGEDYVAVGISIAVDNVGNVYTMGRFVGTVDFDPGADTFMLTAAGYGDIFVSKLDSDGNFVWARSMGGPSDDVGVSMALDSAGNVYTTGYFEGTADFDPGADTFMLTAEGYGDIFVSKLDSVGNFVWARSMGGTSDFYSTSIALDSAGNVYITGYFDGTMDFDPGAGAFMLTSEDDYDIFVSKLDVDANFVWVRSMGGTGWSAGDSIALDSVGNVYTTGWFQGTTDFDPGAGAFILTSEGDLDIFVSKLDADGNFVWAKAMGGPFTVTGTSVTVDVAGNVYTTGYFDGTVDFDPGPGTFNLTPAGGTDIFVSKLDTNGNFVWAKAMGGAIGNSIAVDSAGNVYTTGYFAGTADFDPGAGVYNLTSAGSGDIFVSKLDPNGNFVWARDMGGAEGDESHSIAMDSAGNVYTTGFFRGTVDFDPGASIYSLTSAGLDDIFVLKLSGCGEGALHLADINGDGIISLSELMRIIQFYNLGSITCLAGSEDGYFAGDNGDTTCTPHSGDYNPQDWSISFDELIRMIQFYNSFQYCPCPAVGEDGFCLG